MLSAQVATRMPRLAGLLQAARASPAVKRRQGGSPLDTAPVRLAHRREGMPPEAARSTFCLCAPRGFCAGVVRAIDAVERALALYGPPVYVRHEIVHNKYVVEGLKAEGRGVRARARRGAGRPRRR